MPVNLRKIIDIVVDDCKAVVGRYVHDQELRNLIHNEMDKMKNSAYTGNTDVIMDTFAVADPDGCRLCNGPFDFCSDFLEGSKTNRHLKKASVNTWKIIRLQ